MNLADTIMEAYRKADGIYREQIPTLETFKSFDEILEEVANEMPEPECS